MWTHNIHLEGKQNQLRHSIQARPDKSQMYVHVFREMYVHVFTHSLAFTHFTKVSYMFSTLTKKC